MHTTDIIAIVNPYTAYMNWYTYVNVNCMYYLPGIYSSIAITFVIQELLIQAGHSITLRFLNDLFFFPAVKAWS
jgi:hypothetical protein